jgi:hypothetical protein
VRYHPAPIWESVSFTSCSFASPTYHSIDSLLSSRIGSGRRAMGIPVSFHTFRIAASGPLSSFFLRPPGYS